LALMNNSQGPGYVYRIFDMRLRSSIQLPGLAVCPDGDANLSVCVEEGAGADHSGFEWVHEWKTGQGEVVAACARREDSYLLRFPGLSDFHFLPGERKITAFPSPGISANTLAHLLMDQVIPRVLGHQGKVIMHASAVVMADGNAIAFLGDSGKGKSTLASSFYQAGFGLVTDDSMLLELHDGQVYCLANYPSLRLWPESAERLFPDSADFEAVAHYSNKQQMMLLNAKRVHSEPVPLKAVFVLDDPATASANEEVEIGRISGAAATMALVEAAFVLDVDSRSVVKENFQRVTRIAQSGVPFFRLGYPRRFNLLPRVRASVLEQVPV
jgi:uncharacterized Zn-binding protein involved in type VI secretion